MHRRLFLLLFAGCFLISAAPTARTAESDSALTDEIKLKAAGLPTDGAGLIEFFRLRAAGEVSAEKIAELLEKLESKVAADRLKACAELVAIGPPAVPLLRQVARDVDNPEVAALARRCLKAVEADSPALTTAAIRLLAARRPAYAAEVLLDFLPHAENDSVLEEAKNALVSVAYVKGKAEPAVLKALSDEHPLRRASAIVALCQSGIAEPRATLRKLLNDPMPSVRLRASLALAGAHDAKAVSTLIALLPDLPAEAAREVESFLSDLAGEQAPKVPAGTDEVARQRARDAWAKWWLDTEGPGLLEEVTKRTLTEDDVQRASALIEKLGDDEFDERQKANEALRAMGGRILPLLKQAAKHTDLEIRQAAAKMLETIEKDRSVPLSPVTARLIALRKPKGAAQALLAFIPFADDDALREELQVALNAVAYPAGKPSRVLVKALRDKIGARRAAAAEALALGPAGESLPTIRKMLKDKDANVRLKVALALAGTHERAAVPTLISLVAELPPEGSSRAEEYLTRLAKDAPPKGLPEGDEGRKKRSEMWAAWWKANKGRVALVDRSAPTLRHRFLGYTLLIYSGNPGRVVELGTDHKPRWEINGLMTPYDAQVLPGGTRVLIAEYGGQRVTERNLKGEIIWQKQTVGTWPLYAERLRNGNTFIACRNLLLEVDRGGREVLKIERPHDILTARKLPSGQIVCITSGRQVLRLDRTGKELKSYALPMVFYNSNEVLNNGHILVPLGWQNRLVEYDADGKEIQTFSVMQPMHAFRLPNGHTLVTTQQFPYKVYELDRAGKQVGEVPATGYVSRVRRR
jgi:HEAT repeat protein